MFRCHYHHGGLVNLISCVSGVGDGDGGDGDGGGGGGGGGGREGLSHSPLYLSFHSFHILSSAPRQQPLASHFELYVI